MWWLSGFLTIFIHSGYLSLDLKGCEYTDNTGCFIMFSAITNIYNNNNCSQPQENLKSFFFAWQLEMFDVRTTGDMAHINTIFKFLPHTHQHASTWSLHTLTSPSGRNVNYDEKQLTWGGKKIEFFHLSVQVS
jgi:hypothetical protein